MRNFRYLPGLQRLQERARLVAIEQWIVGFDAQEETVAAGQRESRHVEGWVIEHRQTAQRQQAENGGERRKQNRHLKRDDDVGGPTVQRPSADINRVVDHRHEILQRSEEHTSELQSLRHLVCRLLLEKK